MLELESIKPAWVGLVEILHRLEQQPYHPLVGRTTFQKIAYVATEEGLPTELHHQKGSYGPYSHDLKSLAARLIKGGRGSGLTFDLLRQRLRQNPVRARPPALLF